MNEIGHKKIMKYFDLQTKFPVCYIKSRVCEGNGLVAHAIVGRTNGYSILSYLIYSILYKQEQFGYDSWH